MRIATVAIAVVLLAGCGAGEDERAGEPPPARDVALELRYDDGEGEVREAELRCGGGAPEAAGYLSDADASELCDAARDLDTLLTEQPPEQQACTQIYGGPQTARVTGELAGEDVDRRFSRENGCRIAEWDRMEAAGLLPGSGTRP